MQGILTHHWEISKFFWLSDLRARLQHCRSRRRVVLRGFRFLRSRLQESMSSLVASVESSPTIVGSFFINFLDVQFMGGSSRNRTATILSFWWRELVIKLRSRFWKRFLQWSWIWWILQALLYNFLNNMCINIVYWATVTFRLFTLHSSRCRNGIVLPDNPVTSLYWPWSKEWPVRQKHTR